MRTLRLFGVLVLVILVGRAGPARAQTLTTLHSFTNCDDGANPRAALIQGGDGNFYGTAILGGGDCNGIGVVFMVGSSGAFTEVNTFTNTSVVGAYPYAPLVQVNGNFYGTASAVGALANGTVFEVNPSGALTPSYAFDGGNHGGAPYGGLVLGNDGELYGTTYSGGTGAAGTVFQITTFGSLTTLYSFTGPTTLDGDGPRAGVVQGNDGNFYGTTETGGANADGTVFVMTPGGAETVLHNFDYNDGASPYAGLAQSRDGNFYGTTTGGGAYAGGTVFMITPAGELTTLYNFSGSDGSAPYGTLVQGSDSNFYGTTYGGGAYNQGSIFQLTAGGKLTTLYSFTGGADGGSPYAGLVQGTDGSFYGTTYYGGTSTNWGTVFKLAVSFASGPACGFSITPSNQTFTATGGPSGVSVIASNGCNWTALSGVPFITITSGSTGSGNGTVTYTVAANPSSSGRAGTVAIAGQTLTVIESGSATSVTTKIIGLTGSLAFGNVTTGRTATAILTISNSGNSNLTVNSIDYPTGFSGAFNGTILAGGLYNVTVTFAPLSVGVVSGTVTVNSDATAGANTTTASGMGVAANAATATITVLANPADGGTVSGGGTFTVGASQSISATANSGFTFTGWSDDNTQNPRAITVNAGGATYTADFAAATALITVLANPSNGGTVSGGGTFTIGSSQSITAIANSGWSFTNWSDGNTQNPRPIIVPAAGATFTADFEQPSQSTVAKPTITPDGGDLGDSVKVTLKCVTPKAVIYYTTDRSQPTSSSTKYKGEITLTNSAIIDAVAYVGTNGPSATATASFTISRPAITITNLPSGTVDTEYSPVTLQATGGTAPYKWSLAPQSKLPDGLKLGSDGTISGKPKKADTATITVKVTDDKKGTAEQSFTVTIN